MRVRHENGCTIISDVYEPAELRPVQAPRFWIAFWILAAIIVTCCGLAGLAL